MNPETYEVERAYGPRDPRPPLRNPRDVEGRGLRARPWIPLTGLLFGVFTLSLLGLQVWVMIRSPVRALPGLPHAILWSVAAVVLLGHAWWFFRYPVFVVREGRIVDRSRPWQPAREFSRSAIAWRPEGRYVGRYLLVRGGEGRKLVKLPLWRLRRSDQEALFAWLDATADEKPAGSPPTNRS